MVKIIASIIFFLSLGGMGAIAFRKIPILVELPKAPKSKRESPILVLEKRIKEWDFLQDFSFDLFLQKLLSKIRILTLKTDSKTSDWLQKLREKSKMKKALEDDDYWEEVKKSTNSEES
jgi:hypothetical protein